MTIGGQNLICDNSVNITGIINKNFECDHEMYGEKFFRSEIVAKRSSGVYDYIPLMIPERILYTDFQYINQKVKISGQVRMHNFTEDNSRKVSLYIFTKDIEIIEITEFQDEDINNVILTGYICKDPVYRQTPSGREISDIIIAAKRQFNKADYIPIIVWGRNARYAKTLNIGNKLNVNGRIQSRDYIKHMEDKDIQKRAYEISVSTIKLSD